MGLSTIAPHLAPLTRRKRSVTEDSSLHRHTIRNTILGAISEILQIPRRELSLQQSFLFYGGSSIHAIEVCSKCKYFGVDTSVKILLSSPSLEEVINRTSKETSYINPCLKRRRVYNSQSFHDGLSTGLRDAERFCEASCVAQDMTKSTRLSCAKGKELTEMQRVLLTGSRNQPGTNIIRFSQAFPSQHIPALQTAWSRVLDLESIFDEQELMSTLSGDAHSPQCNFEWTQHVTSTTQELENFVKSSPKDSTALSRLSTVVSSDSPRQTTILWDVNHALIDGYSAMLLCEKVQRLANGLDVQPGTPFQQVARELKLHQLHRSSLHRQFWERQACRFPDAKGKFLIERSKSELRTPVSHATTLQSDEDLHTWSSNHGITPAALHYSVWSLILSAYVGSDTVVFGTVDCCRDLPLLGAQDTIGPLVNTIPFFVHLDWQETCDQYVRRIFQQMLQWRDVESSTPKDGFSRNFDSAIAMEIEMPSMDGFEIQPVDRSSFHVQTDIPVTVNFDTNGRVRFVSQSDRLLGADLDVLKKLYSHLLTKLTISDQSLGECMSEVSKLCYGNSMLRQGNFGVHSTMTSSVNDDLVTLFEQAARRNPNAIAVKRHTDALTYGALDHRAGQLAEALKDVVNHGDVVCVFADRSPNWLIAIYAVLKLGAVYAPLSPTQPAHLRATNYKTAQAVLFLTPYACQKQDAPSDAQTLSVEEVLEKPTPARFPHRTAAGPGMPAYVCFTSGSTGAPKGVVCRHGGLVAFQKDLTVRLNAQPGHNVAQIMSPAFDGSIHEIFSTLSYGATLVLPPCENSTEHLQDCDSAILTPSFARVLDPNDYPRLRQVYLVGEPVPQIVCNAWASSKRLFNMYGPTESTCGATIKELRPHDAVTIGKPNPSCRVYILDHHRRPCPPGVVGDIYTAGIQVAVGYLGSTALNASRFLADPFYPDTEERMYFTGDRGSWTADGEVLCLGRSDRQIKLNGFRLDLNQLEEQILQESSELTAVGLVRKQDFLQACVVPATTNIAQLRSKLVERLPQYAIPRYIIPMDSLPKTAITKVDYAAIEAMSPSLSTVDSSPEPRNWEEIIEDIARETLGLDQHVTLSPNSSILGLGADSLVQLTFANRLSETFGRSIRVRHVIESPTLRDLALSIKHCPPRSPEPELCSRERTVSPQEADWIRKYKIRDGSSAFNVSAAWNFTPGTVDRGRLARAWNTVLASDSTCSSYYVDTASSEPTQAYHKYPPRAELGEFNLAEELDRPFDLEHDHLVRVRISNSCVLVVISHIICDLTTLRTLLKDVASLYADPSAEIVRSVQRGTPKDETPCQSDLDFWSQTLLTAPALATWRDVGPRQTFQGGSDARWLPRSLLKQLVGFCQTNHFTLHQLALAATTLTLQHDRDSMDLVLGAPFMNRSNDELELTGLFLEPLPVRVQHTRSNLAESLTTFLDSVRQASKSALAHSIPWSQLLQHLQRSSDPPHHPFFDVMVTFHELRQEKLLPLPGLEQLQCWSAGSKFKLMVELSAYDEESLLLRLEYDSECFNKEDIDRIHKSMVKALTQITTDASLLDVCQSLGTETDQSSQVKQVQVGDSIKNTCT